MQTHILWWLSGGLQSVQQFCVFSALASHILTLFPLGPREGIHSKIPFVYFPLNDTISTSAGVRKLLQLEHLTYYLLNALLWKQTRSLCVKNRWTVTKFKFDLNILPHWKLDSSLTVFWYQLTTFRTCFWKNQGCISLCISLLHLLYISISWGQNFLNVLQWARLWKPQDVLSTMFW